MKDLRFFRWPSAPYAPWKHYVVTSHLRLSADIDEPHGAPITAPAIVR